tara:strand:+ start:364 stop:1152 length:789 start_codon:yes stop_codon:yes gene_type:complete
MQIIEKSLHKVKRVLNLTRFLYSLISSAIIFLIFTILLKIFSLPIIYALLPGIIYFGYIHKKKKKQLGFGDVEEKIPELEWRLRTSADNKYRHDEIATSLHKDVMDNIQKVNIRTFLGSKNTLYKFTTIIGLILVLTFINVQGITTENLQPIIKDNKLTGFLIKQKDKLGTFLEEGKEAPEDLFGEKANLNYGDEEELLELNQMKGLVDVNNYNDGEGKEFSKESSGTVGKALGSGNSNEKISDKNQELVDKYYKGIYKNKN